MAGPEPARAQSSSGGSRSTAQASSVPSLPGHASLGDADYPAPLTAEQTGRASYVQSNGGNEGDEETAAARKSAIDWENWRTADIPNKVYQHPDEATAPELLRYHEGELPEPEGDLGWKVWEEWMHILELPHESLVEFSEFLLREEHDGYGFYHESELSEQAIGPQPIMPRPPLVVEYPEKFLGVEPIQRGIELPTGAVWRPTVWIFGQNRFGMSYRDDQGGLNFGSFVNRLNLFGQVNLTGTEHFVMQLRPFDSEEGRPLLFGRQYTSGFWKDLTGSPLGDSISELDRFNGDINTAYFEGQLDEILPVLDPYDHRFLDYGFSVGRQPLALQRGLMVNEDMVDAVTLTRDTTFGGPILDSRVTGIFAWNRVSRVAPRQNTDAKLWILSTETEFKFNTLFADLAFVDDPRDANGDLLVFGISSTQRLVGYHNTYNSRFHFLASWPTEGERTRTRFMGSPGNVSGQGELFFSQISMTPHATEDLIYWNTFVAIDQFTSVARAPQAGPLGDTGLLFAAAGLGAYGPPLATVANSSVGTAIGYQMFFDSKEQQIIYEFGGRTGGKGSDDSEIAGAVQYQRAIGQNWIWLVTGFLSGRNNTKGISTGLRSEIQLFF